MITTKDTQTMNHQQCEDIMFCELCDLTLCFEIGHEDTGANDNDHVGWLCDDCHDAHIRECRMCARQIGGGF